MVLCTGRLTCELCPFTRRVSLALLLLLLLLLLL
jgi:hypothetical protein